jgi:hypothetical protein
MSNETERDPKQQQGMHNPAGPVNTSDTKTNPSPGNRSQGRHPEDISKKNSNTTVSKRLGLLQVFSSSFRYSTTLVVMTFLQLHNRRQQLAS